MAKNKPKVFVGLSGGVDSGVSAALLKQQGYEVHAVFIRIALPGYPCPVAEDRRAAISVAVHLDIPFSEIDLSEAYAKKVFAPVVKEFSLGRTPNPDTLCNREIKFGLFHEYALTHGAQFVATGHYAQVKEGNLYAGEDPEKDQSYFLWEVKQEQLNHTLFPVGALHKTEVRRLAQKFRLPNAQRKDSQGLCFLGPLSIEDVLEREKLLLPGKVLSEEGKEIGTHKGVAMYTVGQRHGFELFPNIPHEQAHFVIGKDMAKNTITVSTQKIPAGLYDTQVILQDINWIGPVQDGLYQSRFRYRQRLLTTSLEKTNGKVSVMIAQSLYIPEGQSLVFYDGQRCLGGGVVDKTALIASKAPILDTPHAPAHQKS